MSTSKILRPLSALAKPTLYHWKGPGLSALRVGTSIALATNIAFLTSIVPATSIALSTSIVLATSAAAQAPGAGPRCPSRAADATAETREAAIRLGYEIALQAFDPRLAKTWADRGRRVGEAPGYTVRRLVTKCQPSRRGHSCYVEVTLC